MPKARVLFAASEVYPFAKTGGLADVGYSLPRALSETFDVTVVLPLYQSIDRTAFGITDSAEAFDVTLGGKAYRISLYDCTYEGCSYRFVYAPALCDRKYLYGPPGEGYEDNALRFGLFSHALVHLARRLRSDVVHLNDWQTALAALLIAEDETVTAGTVYTIHNLAYQGVFSKETCTLLGIGRRHFTLEGVEYYDKVNLMKAGIGYADAVTTVSPTYAQEILTSRFGCGLEGYLHKHSAALYGIVNGIDTEHFSPSTDKALVQTYASPEGKRYNKKKFLETAGLSGEDKPLFVFIGRFTWQKGLDLLIEALPAMAESECNIIILGEGDVSYHDRLKAIEKAHENLWLFFGYDEALAHRVYAAADFLLMPSLFEPCGLNQLIAAHYGAVPIVHSVGGLADTVHPYEKCESAETTGCGIGFEAASCEALAAAFEEALALFGDPEHYRRIAAHNMKADVSWGKSADVYASLYRKISKGALE